MIRPLARAAAAALLPFLLVQQSFAWGHDGHSMINRLAVSKLPADTPRFLRSKATQDAMDFYGPVPDSRQWRSNGVPELNSVMAPEHFIDMEYLADVGDLPKRRYQFLKELAAAQAKHPDMKLAPEQVGLLPYAIQEYYERLEAAFRDYRDIVAAKQSPRTIEAEIVFTAGILGHWVADGSQPMHASIQYNGWTGPNPNGYTTSKDVHTRFEGDFVHDNIKLADFAPLVPTPAVVYPDVFTEALAYLNHTNSFIEQTYRIEKTGAFTGHGTPEGKAFVDERLAAGAAELRNMIYSAWINSAKPVAPYKSN
jgi:hypothetical protein